MRVLHFHAGFSEALGGAELYAARLSSAQVHLADITKVAMVGPDIALAEEVLDPAVGAYELRGRRHPNTLGLSPARKALWHLRDLWDPTVARRAKALIGREDPDVVHVHNFQGLGGALLWAVRSSRRPAVFTVYDYSYLDPSTTMMKSPGRPRKRLGAVRKLRCSFYRRALQDAVVQFHNPRTLEIHRAFRFPGRGTDIELDVPGWQLHNHGGPDEPTPKSDIAASRGSLLYMGKLTEAKGIPLLLEAWRRGVPDAKLTIVGDGPLRGDVEAACRQDDTITYLGQVDRQTVSRLLDRAQAVLVPSMWYENAPFVAVEAFLAGKPVIASEMSSPPRVVDEVTGLLVVDTTEAWTSALRRYASDPALRQRLEHGAVRVAASYSWDAHLRGVQATYAHAVTLKHGECSS